MNKKLWVMLLCAAFAVLIVVPAAMQEDAVAVVGAFVAAINDGDAETAVALVGDEEVSTWVMEFIGDRGYIEALNLTDDEGTVSWSGYAARDSWRRTGIASLDVTGEVTVSEGAIVGFAYEASEASQAVIDTVNVILALIDAENAGDVEAAVALFSEDAEVLLAGGMESPVGHEGIRAWQEGLAANNFHLEYTGMTVSENVVSWTGLVSLNVLREQGVAAVPSAWNVTVEDGLITRFEFVFLGE